jgi:hypothetical protein
MATFIEPACRRGVRCCCFRCDRIQPSKALPALCKAFPLSGPTFPMRPSETSPCAEAARMSASARLRDIACLAGPSLAARHFVPPRRPTVGGTARKKLKIRAGQKTLDASAYLLRFVAMLASGRQDHLMHVLGKTLWRDASGKQAKLAIGARPVAHSSEKTMPAWIQRHGDAWSGQPSAERRRASLVPSMPRPPRRGRNCQQPTFR